jgi:hypothetical protein
MIPACLLFTYNSKNYLAQVNLVSSPNVGDLIDVDINSLGMPSNMAGDSTNLLGIPDGDGRIFTITRVGHLCRKGSPAVLILNAVLVIA